MEGDRVAHRHVAGDLISIHALRVEGDVFSGDKDQRFVISIHALRVEGDARLYRGILISRISIHALRVEGDAQVIVVETPRVISIHALRVEGDKKGENKKCCTAAFLSTPSGWRATNP